MAKLTVGVTGAEGFIGSHLVKALKNDPAFKLATFTGDLLKEEDVEKYFSNNPNLDCLVHLAGLFQGDFDALLDANVKTINNVLEIGGKHGLKKIIYSSTGAVYGEPINKKSKETDPLNPVTLYGLVKLYAEECIRYYSRTQNIGYAILRFPNVYGPGNNKGVIYNFLTAVKSGISITLHGDGNQKRDFLYIEDAVKAIISALLHTTKHSTLNIGTGVGHTLNDLLLQLKKLGFNFEINYEHVKPTNQLNNLVQDIKESGVSLGWKSSVNLKDGLRKTILAI